MKSEFPSIEPDPVVSPHAREVEYALILSRMINIVKGDPTQLRLAIYEFARARLKTDTSWAEEAERKRLSAALETAIQGVEQFSVRREEQERIQLSIPSAQIGLGTSSAEAAAPGSMLAVRGAERLGDDLPPRREVYWNAQALPVVEVRTRARLSRPALFSIAILLLGTAGVATYSQRTSILEAGGNVLSMTFLSHPTTSVASPAAQGPTQQTSDVKTAAAPSNSPPFPLPSDYGVYALNNAELSELQALPIQVPDKRVAMSTPINQPSRTTLSDGKAKFVLFRRDLSANAPDRLEVRVVARVVRALTFDARGKPSFSPVSDAWNIRNLSYEFKVRPISGNPEMLLAQSKDTDLALPPGRYVLVLKNEGYDFTVPGAVSSRSQCLERTDAANGSFYTECQKQ